MNTTHHVIEKLGKELKSGDTYWNSSSSTWMSAFNLIGSEAYKDSKFLVLLPPSELQEAYFMVDVKKRLPEKMEGESKSDYVPVIFFNKNVYGQAYYCFVYNKWIVRLDNYSEDKITHWLEKRNVIIP